MGDTCAKLLLLILSLFMPPIAVWIVRNKICSGIVCVNIILTIIGWVNIFLPKKNNEHIFCFYVQGSGGYSCMVCYLLL